MKTVLSEYYPCSCLITDCLAGLAKGWAPTLIGYSMQGIGKFGFYEMFKIVYGNAIGEVSSH